MGMAESPFFPLYFRSHWRRIMVEEDDDAWGTTIGQKAMAQVGQRFPSGGPSPKIRSYVA